jgi:hypothetical protein
MLEPDSRSLLLDALRPPDGYELDRAVGTTFSLDLNTLLTAPLAFAMFDAAASESGLLDVIAVLESTRRYANRISIFCQAGRIAVPKQYHRVFSNVEGTVHEATAPHDGGVFHPKIWALRYLSPNGDEPEFRVLILSRNLTFDRSWDTIVRLDGTRAKIGHRADARQRNSDLVAFLKRLSDISVRPLPDDERLAIDALADQFSDVAFELPNGFNGHQFWSHGMTGNQWNPISEGHDRALIISPFLSDRLLAETTSWGKGHVLISRSEALDAIETSTLSAFEEIYVLDSSAAGADEEDDEDSLSGLHAKTYVVDTGSNSSVLTGSANATNAAFSQNVEFMVELYGRRNRIGIDTFLGNEADTSTLLQLLVPYSRSDDSPSMDSASEALKRAVDRLRHEIAGIRLTAAVGDLDSLKEYSLRITSDSPLPDFPDARVSCRPITLGSSFAHRVELGSTLDVEFPKVSFEAISPFVAFEIAAWQGSNSASISFVVNSTLDGAPADRHQRILSSLLDDKAKVLRYLLFLLADPTSDSPILGLLSGARGASNASDHRFHAEIPLLEALLRALAQDPTRLDPIDRLISDLSKTDEGVELLPPGIRDVWDPIWSTRQELEQ